MQRNLLNLNVTAKFFEYNVISLKISKLLQPVGSKTGAGVGSQQTSINNNSKKVQKSLIVF